MVISVSQEKKRYKNNGNSHIAMFSKVLGERCNTEAGYGQCGLYFIPFKKTLCSNWQIDTTYAVALGSFITKPGVCHSTLH